LPQKIYLVQGYKFLLFF